MEDSHKIMDEFVAESDKLIEQFLDQCRGTPEQGWHKVTEEKGVEVSKIKDDSSPFNFMRGIGEINYSGSLETLLKLFSNTTSTKNWDELFMEGVDIKEKVNSHGNFKLSHIKYNTPSKLVSKRDFCVASVSKKIDNNSFLVCAHSVECSDCPPTDDYVRGEIKTSGHLLERIDENTLKHTFVLLLNLKGSIPSFIMNLISTRQPLTAAGIRDYIEQNCSEPAKHENSANRHAPVDHKFVRAT
eukprot:TRINITY_DN5075_c0_g1_i1.p1 TRINITY_DN5075_c0_g1~~TRINITY_DN5075_c0_g1_i1.p1  ORF type:complete len:243 (-),score=56.78 TRINITY_DN5075_c0_g1_i1:25-753(-)